MAPIILALDNTPTDRSVYIVLPSSRDAHNLHLSGTACDPEPVVRILELRRNARPRGAARHFDVMAPGASARSAPLAGLRSAGVTRARDGIVAGAVPLAAPFVHS